MIDACHDAQSPSLGRLQCRRVRLITSDDPRQHDWRPLDAARMRAGIVRAAEHFGQPIDVFQLAILGEVVYG